jgi:hypothetical protein
MLFGNAKRVNQVSALAEVDCAPKVRQPDNGLSVNWRRVYGEEESKAV